MNKTILDLFEQNILHPVWEYENKKLSFECNVKQYDSYQVITFHGSSTPLDYILSLTFIPWPYHFKFIHLGIQLGMRKAWKNYISKKIDFNKKTYVIGHSLGGGRAQLFHLIYGKYFSDIESIAFGSPRFEWFVSRCFSTIKTIRYVNKKDLVPKLPTVWMGFVHHGKDIVFGSNKIFPLFDQKLHPQGKYFEELQKICLE